MNPLSVGMASDLLRASPTGTAQVFNHLGTHLASNDWLATANKYRTDCIGRLKADLAANTVNETDVAEYIAASIPLHCLDGWTFLARSLSSYINGNAHQAAHFAYYAELRAAMSILASRGVGVFNNRHFFIDQSGKGKSVSGTRPTHEFVWLALDHWASIPASGPPLLDIFSVSSSTFREWFDALPGYNVAQSVALDWLKKWGLDLSAIDSDHDIRNLASYRPNAFSPWTSDSRQCSEFLRSLWTLYEPSTQQFESLDTQLLRILVDQTILTPMSPAGQKPSPQASAQLLTMLNALPFGDPERARLKAVLESGQGLPILLARAGTTGAHADPLIHERVIARAALLLRVSSGFCSSLINGATFSAADLDFWVQGAGIKRAFWSANDQPDPLTDLWNDVSISIENEETWFATRVAGNPDMHEWKRGREQTISLLTQCDRVALWALA